MLRTMQQKHPNVMGDGVALLAWDVFLRLGLFFVATLFDDGGVERTARHSLLTFLEV